MTIVEAVKAVLITSQTGMTSREVYQEIIDRNLYSFPAKKPDAVVNSIIRRHCLGLDFPTANAVKHFKIVSIKGKKPCYALIESSITPVSDVPKDQNTSDLLPEEKIQNSHKTHIATIEVELMRQIMNNHPSFFEKLIVDLLLKMGYGYDRTSGVVVGGPHDGGIDGIISEDKLGLDLIYLQAKRYKPGNTVGRHDLQAFVGAMQNVHKGVFITTSSFTKEAVQYAEQQQQKSLRLIDGKMLSSLMIKYEVGIVVEDIIKIYRLDNAYFE
jgi:restriction system protein